MELYQQPSLCWLAARCPSWESLVPFSARGNLHVSSEAALSGRRVVPGQWAVQAGSQSCRVTGASHQCHPRHLHGEHLNRQFVSRH